MNFWTVFKTFRLRVASLVNYYKKYKKNCRAQKGLGTSLALQCCTGLVGSGFPVRSSKKRQQETKVNYSFFSFIYLLSSYSARFCAPCGESKFNDSHVKYCKCLSEVITLHHAISIHWSVQHCAAVKKLIPKT